MNPSLQIGLVLLAIAASRGAVVAQSAATAPLQRGVSVQLPVTANAVEVPNADHQDALVAAVTADGTVYLGVDSVDPATLANRVRRIVSARRDKTLYVKTDVRAPSARLIEVIDAVNKSGIENLTLLTTQPNAAERRRPVPPQGLELRMVQR